MQGNAVQMQLCRPHSWCVGRKICVSPTHFSFFLCPPTVTDIEGAFNYPAGYKYTYPFFSPKIILEKGSKGRFLQWKHPRCKSTLFGKLCICFKNFCHLLIFCVKVHSLFIKEKKTYVERHWKLKLSRFPSSQM